MGVQHSERNDISGAEDIVLWRPSEALMDGDEAPGLREERSERREEIVHREVIVDRRYSADFVCCVLEEGRREGPAHPLLARS